MAPLQKSHVTEKLFILLLVHTQTTINCMLFLGNTHHVYSCFSFFATEAVGQILANSHQNKFLSKMTSFSADSWHGILQELH